MFALAARSFNQASETFIRQHARGIAPGNTAFVTYDATPEPPLDGPVLADLGRRPRRLGAGGSEMSRTTLPVGLLHAGRTRHAARFFRDTGTEVAMGEFGVFACKLLDAARRSDVRYFVHFHGWDASRVLSDPKVLRLYDDLWARAQGFFAPSRFIADKLIAVGCPADRIAVTPCGVDPDAFPMSARVPGRCIMVGRMVDKKAPLVSIRAFARVADKHPDARLDVIGDGPRLAECKAEVAGMDLPEGRILFHGVQPHDTVRRMMSEASIFLQHSVTTPDGNTEGLPVSVLEAMSAGLCVVSTRHSGIPEAVIDSESGLLVDEHDTEAMAQVLDHALADPAMCAGLGDAAAARVRASFTIDHAIETLRDRMGLTGL